MTAPFYVTTRAWFSKKEFGLDRTFGLELDDAWLGDWGVVCYSLLLDTNWRSVDILFVWVFCSCIMDWLWLACCLEELLAMLVHWGHCHLGGWLGVFLEWLTSHHHLLHIILQAKGVDGGFEAITLMGKAISETVTASCLSLHIVLASTCIGVI